MVLSDRERLEVRAAVVEYIKLCGVAPDVIAAVEAATAAAQEGALEKRWSTIRRLSAKNVELEGQVRSLQQEITVGRAAKTATSAATIGAARPLVPAENSFATLRGHRDTLTSISFHPTEPLCFSSSEDGSVRVWDVESRSLVSTIRPHTDSVNQVCVEPTVGDLIATCSNDCTIKLHQQSNGQHDVGTYRFDCLRTLLGHSDPVVSVAWSGREDKLLLSGARNGEVRIWETDKCVARHIVRESSWVRCIAVPASISEVGRVQFVWASCGNDSSISVRDEHGALISTIGVHENVVHVVVFSHYSADAVIAEHHGSESVKKLMLDAKAQAQRRSRTLRTTLASGEVVHVADDVSLVDEPAYTVKFIASGGRDKLIRIFELASPQSEPVLTLTSHENWVRGIHFTRSGKFLVSVADDGLMLVHDLLNGRLHRKILAHDHFVTAMSFACDSAETMLATGSADTTVKLWRCV